MIRFLHSHEGSPTEEVFMSTAKRTTAILFMVAVALVQVGCGGSKRPTSFVMTPNESGIWKSIEVREGATRAVLWSTVVDALSSKFDIEVLDKESGYVRTGWNSTIVTSGGGGGGSISRLGARSAAKASENRYRSRIMTKFNADFSVLQIKSEANWLDEGNWVVGYDTLILDDIYGDLQGRIGRVRR
jgi:hypothetical protein